LKCIRWQLDSSNGTYCFDANNKDKDGLQGAYNEAENIYQERVLLQGLRRYYGRIFCCHLVKVA
jgi:hypothetical protein